MPMRPATRLGAVFSSRACRLARPDLIAQGLHDCIHEPYRAEAVPDLREVRDALIGAGALGAVLSGAGPAVIGLVHGEGDAAALEAAREVAENAGTALAGLEGRSLPQACGIERHAPVAG